MIGIRQFDTIYKKHFLEFLKLGFQPSYNDVIQRAGKDLPDISSVDEPIYKYKPQGRNQIFDTILYNKSIQNIGYDLNLLFEELNEITKENIKRVLHSDLFHSVHNSELSRLNHTLDALLFETDGAEENFFVQFEDFSSTSKVDSKNSDTSIINTAEGKLVLPIGMKGTSKVNLIHLESLGTPIDLNISNIGANNLGNIPGTIFGNIVKDTAFPWGIIIESNTNEKIDIKFTIRLKNEEFINKISLVHHGEKPQLCTIRTSIDKTNIKDLDDYAEGVELKSQSTVVSLDFEDRLVDYIHVKLSKTEADSYEDLDDGSKKFRYIFGLKNISTYSTGRKEKATYQSKPFDFSDSLEAIGKVAITSKVSIPEDTSINYSIAGVDSEGNVGQFLTITPDNYTVSSGPPKVRVLQDIFADSLKFTTTDSSPTIIESANNIDFYNIASVPTEPLFGSALLYRGNKAWLRDNSQAVNPILVKDNFIPFSKGDTQSLYNITTESITPVITNVNNTSTYIGILTKSPLYDPSKGHFVIPANSINPETDTQPNYAIYSAIYNLAPNLVSTGYTFTFETGAPPGGIDGGPRTFDTGVKLIKYEDTSSVTLKTADGTTTYINGIDYIVVLNEEGFPTGEITGIHIDLIAEIGTDTWQEVIFTYDIDTNLTRFVENITGQQVFLNIEAGQLLEGVSVIFKYRHIAKDILKASVKAKSVFGIAAGAIYTQGIDYIFDSTTGNIQRLSTGSIKPGTDIYIDFKFNDTSEQLEQFFIWAYFKEATEEDKTIIKVELQDTGFFSTENTLTPDTEKGEEVLVSVSNLGLVNLVNATEWPAMNGWVQFIVKSTNPDEFENALIKQIIKLKDLEGEFIFVEGGKYFSMLTALRDSLTQVSYPLLKHNTLKKDHTRFAVRKVLGGTVSYQVVINFKPNTDTLLYRYAPNTTEETEENDGTILVDEEWEFKWSTPETSSTSVNKIVVKIDLSRDTNSDGNITPKVDDYFLKVGI